MMKTGHNDLWRSAVITIDSTLQDAISNLEQSGLRIVLVLDTAGRLNGTISDGDIRRGLLKGLGLRSSISEVLHHHPFVAPEGMGRELVQQLMTANKIQQIPVVDEEQRVIGLHLWDEISTRGKRPNTMVIMAGGKGTRLRPHTENCPKPMVPVAGKPMLEHIIDRAHAAGFSRFVLAIHYLGHMIEDHFGNGEQFGVQIDYLRETEPLGTAGALSLLDPVPDAPFVVTNGDVLTDIDYGELLDFHVRHRALATMAVRAHEWQNPYGVVLTEGIDIIGMEEKPVVRSHINAGVYVLTGDAIAQLSNGMRCDMPTLFETLHADGGRTIAYPMHEPWLDVGRPGDLDRAEFEMKDRT
jgi:dTDP-glucose pyrophosphorylase